MSTLVLPSPKQVRDLLAGLLGRDTEVAPGHPVSLNDPACLAVYVDEHLATTALWLVDVPLSAWCAGALALLPKGGLEDAVEEGVLSDVHVEVLHEVVNVAASLFNTPGATHSRLHRLHPAGESVPADLAALSASTNRLDLGVTVAGYGTGGLSVVLAG